jgi:trimeric autotransporter adhesin
MTRSRLSPLWQRVFVKVETADSRNAKSKLGVLAMIFRAIAFAAALVVVSITARGECPPFWTPTFPSADASSTVSTSIVFDDGTGPALWVGGSFTSISGVPALRIAKYDGTRWTQPGRGLNNAVNALAVYNNNLYAAGTFTATAPGTGSISINRIARWNGTDWEPVGVGANNGVNGPVNALAVYNNELYLGGTFINAGTVTNVNRLARWNGTAWAAVASGLNDDVVELQVLNDGTGTKLWIGGTFTASGATTNILAVARWDGSSLSAVGPGFTGGVTSANALALFNGSVYAGGVFTNSGVNSLSNIARWSGTQWVDVGGGANAAVNTLITHNDGSGNALYASGAFTTNSAGTFTGSPRLVRWNGAAWVNTGNGLPNGQVNTASAFNDGTGNALFLGGTFTGVGAIAVDGGAAASRLAKWNGSHLTSAGRGLSGIVNCLVATSEPNPSLLAVGSLTRAGTQVVSQVALYNGTSWSALGTSAFDSAPLAAIHFNSTYFVAGNFTTYGGTSTTRIATWNGSTFVGTPTVFNADVRVFVRHNNDLYAAGDFSAPVGRVARYNGSTWTALGTGVSPGSVFDAASYNGELYVAGSFTVASGSPALRVAKWNGTAWSALGNGLNAAANALAVHEGELFVAGDFTTAGTGPASRVARWNGTTWSDAAGGMNGNIEDLVVINDNGTETLFAIGSFTVASGNPAANIALWNGCRWEPISTGLAAGGLRLGAVNTGPAKGVYVPGTFSSAGGEVAHNLARIETCIACPSDLDNGSGTGRPDGGVTIDDLLYFLSAFEGGGNAADIDNGSGSGLCDGGVTIDDLLYFLVHFEAGC